MPNTTSFNNVNNWNQNKSTAAPPPPPEDKYAALKDLDNALKSQTTIDWSSSGSNGSLYSSPTPTGSVYSSPSPQNSVFGSPSQGKQYLLYGIYSIFLMVFFTIRSFYECLC